MVGGRAFHAQRSFPIPLLVFALNANLTHPACWKGLCCALQRGGAGAAARRMGFIPSPGPKQHFALLSAQHQGPP